MKIGAGVSLVLDEFALFLHLQDVYWSNEGRLSVNLVSLNAAFLKLALTGLSPLGVGNAGDGELVFRPGASDLRRRGCRRPRAPVRRSLAPGHRSLG